MKTALVHEWFITPGGSEKVVKAILEIFPADLFALLHNRQKMADPFFTDKKINTSFLQSLPLATKKYQWFLPLFPLAIEQFDLSEYQLIISSSHSVAKGVLTHSEQVHVCYCHTPARYFWDLYNDYLREQEMDNYRIKGVLARLIFHYLRNWDYLSASRVDHFVANSNYVAGRIKKTYGRDAKVIYPPVKVENFPLSSKKEDYYLTVSRLVPYKKIDLIVQAFSQLPEKKLLVIGDGPEADKIKKLAGKNIELLGWQDFEQMRGYLQKAKAFVFAAREDFGIVNVEAQSCGTPVIAFGAGGALETVRKNETGVFFAKQSVQSIIEAIRDFEKREDFFDYAKISEHAQKFSEEQFKNQFRDHLNDLMSTSTK